MLTPSVDMSDYDQLGCLHELFMQQAKKTPHKVAIINHDGKEITYEDLDAITDLLACKLQRLGFGKNNVAGIIMERCTEYSIAYISILKAGGGYLPIEVSWPTPLIESVLKDAQPFVIFSKEAFSAKLSSSKIPLILLDNDWSEQLRKESGEFPLIHRAETSLDDIAYIVYSSGTTGTPKGIQCPHRGAVFSYTWRHRAYPYVDDDREACNVYFVWEMLRPLIKGIPMYIIPDNVIYDPPKLAHFIKKNKITRMLFTPSLLQAVMDYKGLDIKLYFKSLRLIIYCGEVVTTALRDKVASLMPWIQQLNLYSISECHDVANADLSEMQCDKKGRQYCPVGHILPGVHVVVMDQDLITKPVGEPGEIFVGGPTLAIGYLNRPDLNEVRFINRPPNVNPIVGSRLYRTGDWGYVLSDGSLEICGRCDTMVKIRGYTIELEAIRLNLLELKGVLSASVQVYGSEGEEKTLIAFIVLKDEVSMNNHQMCSHLKKKLPFYMIPSRFIILENLPVIEATGKLDTKLLTEIYLEKKKQVGSVEVTKTIGDTEVPVTSTEKKIARIWSGVLNICLLDTEDSFFDIGGHSLLAATLASKINEEFGVNLSTASIFKYPTISEQALVVAENSTDMEFNKKLNLQQEVDKFPLEFSRMDSIIRTFWKTVSLNPSKFVKGNVLLTGATGYVGCFLLEELLLHTQATIFCLVRDIPNQNPLERLVQARELFGLRKFVPTDRVIPIKGDVSLMDLGLNKDIYNALSLDLDVVVHAAAQVNLILPYSALYSSNVIGTYNVLQFSFSGKLKPLHYISTNAVFPEEQLSVDEAANMSDYSDRIKSGYGQTKWVAEQLILNAVKRGFPAVVYRCGNVGGSCLIPSWNPMDFNLHMFIGVLKTGTAPNINWKIELTPVDFVSKTIIHLVCNLHESVGKVFHMINSSSFDCKKLWKIFQDKGYSITNSSYSEWKKTINENSKNDNYLSQLSFMLEILAKDETFFTSSNYYTQQNLSEVLMKSNTRYPELTTHLFDLYIENLASIGVIPKLKQKPGGLTSIEQIKDKVVLITGASSGIGEGIARVLAKAGAKVVLAARRIEKLQKIAEELKQFGNEALPLEMDVCNAEQVSSCVNIVESKFGPIDVLINNAGILYYQFMKDCEYLKWQHMIEVNINGPLNCLAAILNKMVARGSGHIVNITSDAARKPFAGLAVYSGTKYFVHCLSGAMRVELASYGIKVTDIQPGDVASELHRTASNPEAELMYDWSTKVPILKPSDVGEAVLYSLSQPAYCAINEILLEPQMLPL